MENRRAAGGEGAMLVIESGPGEFFIVGAGLTVKMSRDPDTDTRIAGLAAIEEVSRTGSEWVAGAGLNGGESNQGRQLIMPRASFGPIARGCMPRRAERPLGRTTTSNRLILFLYCVGHAPVHRLAQ
jgi:hypothetical protein